MKIGEAAVLSGVSRKMIRYYESIGLIEAASRSQVGYRSYSESDVHALRFIRRCRDLGFGLGEIGELLALWHDRGRKSAEVRKLASTHVAALESRIEALRSVADTLRTLIGACHGDERPDCPILTDFEGGSRPREEKP